MRRMEAGCERAAEKRAAKMSAAESFGQAICRLSADLAALGFAGDMELRLNAHDFRIAIAHARFLLPKCDSEADIADILDGSFVEMQLPAGKVTVRHE